MSNGMPIVIRGFMKPIPTLIKPLGTVAVALRLDAAARIRRRIATTSDTALEPVPVGAGDIP